MHLDFNRPPVQRETKQEAHLSSSAQKVVFGSLAVIGLVIVIIALLLATISSPQYAHGVLLFDSYSRDSLQSKAKLLWIQPDKRIYTLVELPGEMEFGSRRLGYYPLRSLATALTTHNQKDFDAEAELSFFFRLPIQGFVISNREVNEDPIQLARFVFSGCLSSERSLTVSTCLGLVRDTVSPGISLRTVKAPETLLSKTATAEVQPINRDAYRVWSQRVFSGQPVALSHFTVSVMNASEVSGSAKATAQILEDFGFSIIQTTQLKEPLEQGELILSQRVSESVAIKQILEDIFHLPVRIDDERVRTARSDIVVVIGKEEAKLFIQ